MAMMVQATASPTHKADQHHSAKNLMGSISGDRVGINAAIASQPTSEMRIELEAAGVTLPDDAQLTQHSEQLNEWLEEMRHADGKEHSTSWFNLFAAIDEGARARAPLRMRACEEAASNARERTV